LGEGEEKEAGIAVKWHVSKRAWEKLIL